MHLSSMYVNAKKCVESLNSRIAGGWVGAWWRGKRGARGGAEKWVGAREELGGKEWERRGGGEGEDGGGELL